MTSFENAFVAHFIADWILQNDWMAQNKTSLRHPASWTHATIYGLCIWPALGGMAALVLGFLHLLVDTRVPLNFWMRYFKQCVEAPDASSIAIWLDQTLHIVCIAGWLWFVGK